LPAWWQAREIWAGLSIITMWLAVLFVGLYGGSLVSNHPPNITSLPVVVFFLPFVLPATIVIARRAFAGATDDVRAALEAETRAREELAAEVEELRAKVH
jgi:hypothetical protein